MALTESQKLKIAKILGVTYIEVQEQVTYLGSTHLTSEAEAQIGEEIERWETVATDYTNIRPNVKNFGAEINYNDQKSDIRKNLATLLYFTELMKSSGITSRVMRG